jgi:hypothetical protein
MWLVISLILDIRLLRSLMLGRSVFRLLGSPLLGRSELRPRSGHLLVGHFELWQCSSHLLLTLIIQSLKKGLLSVSGGRSALQTKTTIKYIKRSSKVIMNDDM